MILEKNISLSCWKYKNELALSALLSNDLSNEKVKLKRDCSSLLLLFRRLGAAVKLQCIKSLSLCLVYVWEQHLQTILTTVYIFCEEMVKNIYFNLTLKKTTIALPPSHLILHFFCEEVSCKVNWNFAWAGTAESG